MTSRSKYTCYGSCIVYIHTGGNDISMFIYIYKSVYVLSSRVSTVKYNVDDFGRKADSVNAVYTVLPP
ncbi:MAG: hypothetical protein ACKPKO_35095 [Candidatus Fonsibacter sp.]